MSWKQSYGQRRAAAARRNEEPINLMTRLIGDPITPTYVEHRPADFPAKPRVMNPRWNSYIVATPTGGAKSSSVFEIVSRALKTPLCVTENYEDAVKLKSRFEQARRAI